MCARRARWPLVAAAACVPILSPLVTSAPADAAPLSGAAGQGSWTTIVRHGRQAPTVSAAASGGHGFGAVVTAQLSAALAAMPVSDTTATPASSWLTIDGIDYQRNALPAAGSSSSLHGLPWQAAALALALLGGLMLLRRWRRKRHTKAMVPSEATAEALADAVTEVVAEAVLDAASRFDDTAGNPVERKPARSAPAASDTATASSLASGTMTQLVATAASHETPASEAPKADLSLAETKRAAPPRRKIRVRMLTADDGDETDLDTTFAALAAKRLAEAPVMSIMGGAMPMVGANNSPRTPANSSERGASVTESKRPPVDGAVRTSQAVAPR